MFNLLVSSHSEAWEGAPHYTFELSRCVREYTDPEITEQYGALDAGSIAALMQMPAIFAYEDFVGKDPRLGRLTRIERRVNSQQVYLEYELFDQAFFSNADLWALEGALDLGKWEKNRTHWSVKGVDLGAVLNLLGYALPNVFANPLAPQVEVRVPVNVANHVFQVAFSFPGPYRETVERVVRHTTARLGPDSCFYDFDYQAQLARPGIDVLLQQLYTRARLIVIFLGSEYQARPWPSIEWNAIRGIINARQHERIMFIRMDDGAVDGVQPHDGYVDARNFDAPTLAAFVAQRVWLLPPEGAPAA